MSDPNAPTPAEQLARMFHDAYERLAPQFDYMTRCESAVPWDAVPENNRALMVAVSAEIIEALLEGKIIEYPDPGNKLGMLISKTNDAKIRIDFQKPAKWFAFDEAVAIHFALTILQNCGIPVQVNIAPVPEQQPPVPGRSEGGEPV